MLTIWLMCIPIQAYCVPVKHRIKPWLNLILKKQLLKKWSIVVEDTEENVQCVLIIMMKENRSKKFALLIASLQIHLCVSNQK